FAGLIAIAPTIAPAIAAQGTDPAVKGMRTEWGMTAGFLRTAVEQMPEADFAYKPVSTVRTFGEIIKHITATQMALCGVALGDKKFLSDGVETASTKKADIARELQDSMEYCSRAYAQDIAKLDIDAAQRQMRYDVLAHNTAHNGEHYGNIATYMRMKGMVPPSSQR
ncbi:MAG TPA: DinB family protein, partial [Gemmatimonadaceae bacterium]|nr:DinB family protein [Gemmatimonadaceae bacterium]